MPEANPELSRPIDLDALGAETVATRIEANSAECEALARRFGLPAIHSVEGEVDLTREPGAVIRATGWLRSRVRRVCVVTLDEFDQTVEDRFSLYFTDAPEAIAGDELDIVLDEDDAPEPLPGGVIDCGELVAQQLSLAMDPFPRSPEAMEAGPQDRTEAEPANEDNPFRRLKGLVGRKS